ncbi:thioredoxin reductase (NADPH),trxA; thioredoxin 1 [Myxococcaceae bacterium]|jgi:thioredoxin reductase (NADPH)|nr:thioredoxin reductase (NADPH),trxA; thioredoxin 1 [Myxococcaceae bacterium]
MPVITMYTKPGCSYCDRAKALLSRKGQIVTEIDIEAEPQRRDEMIERTGRYTVPQIFIGDRHVGGSDELHDLEVSGELDGWLGVSKAAPREPERARIVIIGSGPAGYTAGIYAGRADLAPVMFAGLRFGGQLMLTTEVENYPGFPEGVTGPEMMELFQKQAERFGTRVIADDVTEVDFSRRPFLVAGADDRFLADAVIVATGASARWLGLESEARLVNKGVSACATCDGALFRGKAMAVIGGGDTAMEEALFLTRYASKVSVVHRRDRLRASKIMQDRALANPKIEFVWNSEVDEVLGDEFVTGLRVRDVGTGEKRDLPLEAVFVAIGHEPNTQVFRGQLALDPVGYVKVEPGSSRTSVEGVFACGDATDPHYRQAVTAAGTGCMAAIDAERWLAAQGIE